MARAALIVAHPGHELQVHGWIEKAKPIVFVLTDGSGSAGRSRLASSRLVLEAAGARPGPVFGACTDRELYAAVLGGDTGFFLEVARRIGRTLVEDGVDTVVGDSAEGYNPGHDVCRLLADAAVADLRRATGGHVDSYDYPVVGTRPDPRPPAMSLQLDDDALARKLGAARAYAGLEGEVEAAIDRHTAEGLRSERFFAVAEGAPLPGQADKPFYETYGERQVAAGHYSTVLRFEEHMLPLVRALANGR